MPAASPPPAAHDGRRDVRATKFASRGRRDAKNTSGYAYRSNTGELLRRVEILVPPLMAIDHRNLRGAHRSRHVDREGYGHLLLPAFDQLRRIRLPLIRRAVPEAGEVDDSRQHERRQPRRNSS